MEVRKRIKLCRILERIERQADFADRLYRLIETKPKKVFKNKTR